MAEKSKDEQRIREKKELRRKGNKVQNKIFLKSRNKIQKKRCR